MRARACQEAGTGEHRLGAKRGRVLWEALTAGERAPRGRGEAEGAGRARSPCSLWGGSARELGDTQGAVFIGFPK